MVNESDIFNNFTKFFQDAERLIHKNKVSIDADGKLNVLGDVVVKLEYTTHQSTGLPFGKLPVQFGTVSGTFSVAKTRLQSLAGAPVSVGGICWISDNLLTSLEGGPQHIHHLLIMDNLPALASLTGFPPDINTCRFTWRKDLPLLRLLQAKRLILSLEQQGLLPSSPPKKCLEILNKYLPQGKRGMFDCQKELEDAGFPENARW